MSDPLRGTYSVMITAFNEAGELDVPALARFVDWQIEQGIHGLIPLGSTGEFLSLTDDERTAVAATVVDTAAGRVPVVIGTGAERTEDAIRYARDAERLGAAGVMVIPPYYSTPTDDELFRHYARIAEAISIPVMLYNNPATANVDLVPSLVARLSDIDGIEYIKESTMDVTRVRDILDLCGDRMQVFGGIMGFESFVEGATGWVAVASNLLPKACAELFTTVADRHDLIAGREIYRTILPVVRAVGGHRYVAATKTGLARLGYPVGEPRSPRLPTPADEIDAVAEALRRAGALPSEALGSA